jgi:hypothetical protein
MAHKTPSRTPAFGKYTTHCEFARAGISCRAGNFSGTAVRRTSPATSCRRAALHCRRVHIPTKRQCQPVKPTIRRRINQLTLHFTLQNFKRVCSATSLFSPLKKNGTRHILNGITDVSKKKVTNETHLSCSMEICHKFSCRAD